MGSKNKLKRFKENLTIYNLIQPQREDLLSLKFLNEFSWNDFFENKNKIVLELGCGKGEYTIELAKQNSSLNYVGIDIKGDRIWRGAKTSIESGLKNVAFVRTQIELVDFLFQKSRFDWYHIDPFLVVYNYSTWHASLLLVYRYSYDHEF